MLKNYNKKNNKKLKNLDFVFKTGFIFKYQILSTLCCCLRSYLVNQYTSKK